MVSQEHYIPEGEKAILKPMHPTSVEGVDDMIRLGDLSEAGLLRNLLVRHKQSIIYTYIGSVLVAMNPYQMLPIYTADQVGESGAGKTESTKLILQFLAAVSGQHSWIEQQIIHANPVLEAFGNAKTIRNDNSSRFGKYVEVYFNKEGIIEGAHMEQYLLEKSRVCHQAPHERNYHIFYCMLSGMQSDHKKTLSLGDASQFKYLTEGDCLTCDGRDDADEFGRIRAALKILTFSDRDCWEIFKLLAAILHMGNIDFQSTTMNNMDSCDVLSSNHFSVTAKLLEVQRNSLTHRSFMTNREIVTKPLSSEQATSTRDTFAKAMYGRLFVWMFTKVNSAIHKPQTDEPSYTRKSIGLLDIFGFENFPQNSFEQLCINYANEHLQQFFVRHIFKLEQDEYSKEGISWKRIAFSDNQKTLDLLAIKPLNILALIDEESTFPKGTDATMLNKMNTEHSGNKLYMSFKGNHGMSFGVKHFAGTVYYDCEGFLEKNRDALSMDILGVIQKSSNKLLKLIFEKEMNTNSFRQSLDSLMKALALCQPFFIRCFKPNDKKMPMVFDRNLCMQQLRYSGMLDTIKIRKLGYPIRHTFKDFLQRYRVLLKSVDSICRAMIKDKEDWKIGKNKIFLRDHHDSFLELEREQELYKKALIIQRVMIAHKDRSNFVKKRRAALVLQKNWRGHRDRRLKQGFARLQAKVRSRQLHTEYIRRRAAAITLQTQTRGYLARKDLKRKKDAVILLQTQTRGLLARKTLKRMKTDVKKEAQERIALELQQRLEELLKKNEEAAKSQKKDEEDTVENIFGFLPSAVGGQEGPAPEGFEEKEREREREKEKEKERERERERENDEFSFSKFASLHFQGSSTHSYIQQRLRQPLLHHEDEGDTLACLTVWWIILRFMGDLPEPKQERVSAIADPIQMNLGQRQARRLSSLPEEQPKPKMQAVQEEEDVLFGERATYDRPMTPLEKLHIIVGYAIVRHDIRDEIYCQILKQLTDNKNHKSTNRGWTLLSICLGIFPPTDRLTKYLQSFIRYGPSEYSSYCAERLQRTLANGERSEPPCWVELQVGKNKKPISVAVGLMDGRSISITLDSASSSAEVCSAIIQKIKLQDTYGFSLYAAMYEKIWSLGSGSQHVLDAVSMCEQEEKRQGKEEQHAPWRLYFRKEIFTPWHDCSSDQVSTDLIYKQIIHGLKSGDYQSDKEDDYVQLAAKHYYVQHGSESSMETTNKIVRECMSMTLIENKSVAKLVQMVHSAHTQGPYINSTKPAFEVKAEIVQYAQEKWPVYFSRLYEAEIISGPSVPQDQFVVVVNWKGVFFQDVTEAAFMQLSYPEVSGIEMRIVCLMTPKGMYELKVVKGKDFVELVNMFISGLKERSQYAVAIQDLKDPTLLSYRRGDVLYIIKDGEYSSEEGWIKARNERTNQTGAISLDAIRILPMLTRPTEETLVNMILLFHTNLWRKLLLSTGYYYYSCHLVPLSIGLREPKEGGRGKGGAKERLWANSKEPLKQPLLRSLQGNSEICHLASDCFTDILPDYPVKHVRTPIDLTNQIFGPATARVELRDEIYCQIMKQMTNNNHGLSMERGWQLLWLCCGLFPPSQLLLRHAQRFLESRTREPLASTCLQRMQAIIEGRKLPPHQVEVDAIQNNSTQIFHKVHFPNDTSEIFEVTSTMRIKDLCRNIAKDLRLSSSDGYSLFVKTSTKVVSMDSKEYFFDNLRQLTDVVKKGKKVKEATPTIVPYLVLFMRKLWFNVIPGKDITADLAFHFPQELPKYLRGYHNVAKEDMISLAGLLFRIQVETDKSQFVMIPRMLKDLVPADQQRIMTPDDWKKHIINAYNKQAGITVDEAKLQFLKTISQWPTFGCVFFEVKQTSEKSYPSVITLSISKQGVSIINPKTKEVLVMHLFSKITSWSSGNTYFHLTIGNLVQGNTLLCETSVGYRISDLLSSYKDMYLNEIPRVRKSKGINM
uniref:Myosin VIIBb n=1 Tax=Cyprinus carpio TaxID=7962 RepID=A0A8C2D981_CYPCA